jgi:hypothetical protein
LASKRGFGVPLREWFKENSFVGKLETLNRIIPKLNISTISEIFQLNQEGKRDYGNFIWMLFILQKIIADNDK